MQIALDNKNHITTWTGLYSYNRNIQYPHMIKKCALLYSAALLKANVTLSISGVCTC